MIQTFFERRACSALVVGAVLALSGCGGDPWLDSRREAGTVQTVGMSTTDRPALCYAGDIAEAGPQLLQLANQQCAKTNRRARYVGSTHWQCRLWTPHRAFFVCE